MAGATGFEPAVSCVTGRCVKPGYTTPPRCEDTPANVILERLRKTVNACEGLAVTGAD